MKISTIRTSNKQIMKVFAAREYDLSHPRLTNYVEVNIPEYTPTIPRDANRETFALTPRYCVNTNFPVNSNAITIAHYVKLPLVKGSHCPVYFKKDTPFLLLSPSGRIEDGYLLYI